MATTTKFDFSSIKTINANNTDLTELWYKTSTSIVANCLWTKSTSVMITVTLNFSSILAMGDSDTHTITWTVPSNYTWQYAITNKLVSGKVDNIAYSLQTISSTDNTLILVVGQASFWLASNSADMILASDNITEGETYFLVSRTKDGEDVNYKQLKLGNNIITIKGDEPNFYLYCNETGKYKFTADSDNAFLGYETKEYDEEGYEYSVTDWVEGTSFTLDAKKDDILYICCSNQDFSDETYNLNIERL